MKYLHQITLIIALIFFGCSDQQTETNKKTETKKEIRNGQYVVPGDDGLMQQIGNYNNGKKDGVFIFFDTKGNVIAQEYYVDNKLHGPAAHITVHSTGKIHKSVTYEYGVKHGPYVTNYKTGKLQETGSYKEGKKDGEIIFYYDTGQKHSVYTYENGKVIEGPITYSKEGVINSAP